MSIVGFSFSSRHACKVLVSISATTSSSLRRARTTDWYLFESICPRMLRMNSCMMFNEIGVIPVREISTSSRTIFPALSGSATRSPH